MSIVISVTDDNNVGHLFDMKTVINVQMLGIEAAWEQGCDMLSKMVNLLPEIQNRHNRVKADAYQRFKRLPVNKDTAAGDYNPGTDKFFDSIWLSSCPEYQASRLERDRLEDAINTLRLTYLPRIKQLHDKAKSSEHNVTSRVTEPTATPVPIPPPPGTGIAPAPLMATTR